MHSKAAVLFNINQPLEILNLKIPKLKPGQVLVEIAYSGICRSQLNEIKGFKGEDKFLPHTLGHEGSGKVLRVSEGVSKVKPGDHVVLSWIKGKGSDFVSFIYDSEKGLINSGPISTFMQKTVTSENRLIPIPENMPLKEAALLGCAIPTGAGIVINDCKFNSSSTIAVFGAGGIGLSSIMAASALNVNKVIAIDIFDHKLRLAKKIGATHIINAKKKVILNEVMKITDGKGVDYSIEAIGNKNTIEKAFQLISFSGGKCIIAGNPPSGEMISIDPMDLIKGKKIIGTWGGQTNPDKDIPLFIKWFNSGKMPLNKLITHEYSLNRINKAFSDLENGKVGRALLNIGSETK